MHHIEAPFAFQAQVDECEIGIQHDGRLGYAPCAVVGNGDGVAFHFDEFLNAGCGIDVVINDQDADRGFPWRTELVSIGGFSALHLANRAECFGRLYNFTVSY